MAKVIHLKNYYLIDLDYNWRKDEVMKLVFDIIGKKYKKQFKYGYEYDGYKYCMVFDTFQIIIERTLYGFNLVTRPVPNRGTTCGFALDLDTV